MPLFIDITLNVAQPTVDLFSIARCDTAVGQQNVSDPTATQVTYNSSQKKNSGAGPDRLFTLCNSIATNIVIHAVNSSYILPDGTPITQSAGQTFPFDGTAIRIIYDCTSAGGSGYFVFNTGGSQISFPSPVLLFHELSHAFHLAKGDSPPPGPAAEHQAITDEDAFRQQVGIALRDPNNHAGGVGSGNGQDVPQCGGSVPPIKCFVVGAAYGSEAADHIEMLRSRRTALSLRSELCADVIGGLVTEYYQFSPAVASDMNRRPCLKHAIKEWLVDPLLCFVEIFEAYLQFGREPERFERAAKEHFSRFLDEREHNLNTKELTAVRNAAADLTLSLQSGNPESEMVALPLKPFNCADPALVFAYFRDMIKSQCGTTSHLPWGLQALHIFWDSVGQQPLSGSVFASRLAQWLSSAPVPESFWTLPADQLREEFEGLAYVLLQTAQARQQVATRLLGTCAGEHSSRVKSVLQEAGYLDSNTEGVYSHE